MSSKFASNRMEELDEDSEEEPKRNKPRFNQDDSSESEPSMRERGKEFKEALRSLNGNEIVFKNPDELLIKNKHSSLNSRKDKVSSLDVKSENLHKTNTFKDHLKSFKNDKTSIKIYSKIKFVLGFHSFQPTLADYDAFDINVQNRIDYRKGKIFLRNFFSDSHTINWAFKASLLMPTFNKIAYFFLDILVIMCLVATFYHDTYIEERFKNVNNAVFF